MNNFLKERCICKQCLKFYCARNKNFGSHFNDNLHRSGNRNKLKLTVTIFNRLNYPLSLLNVMTVMIARKKEILTEKFILSPISYLFLLIYFLLISYIKNISNFNGIRKLKKKIWNKTNISPNLHFCKKRNFKLLV